MPVADNFQFPRNDEADFRYYRNLETARGEMIEKNPINYYQLYFEALMMNFAIQKQYSVHIENAYYFFEIKTRLSVLSPKSGLYSM